MRALLGCANRISEHSDNIKLWSSSFKRHSEGEVILLCANSSFEDIEFCRSLGIKAIPVSIESEGEINHKRLEHNVSFLKSSNIESFIVTDVYDVAFQGDPFSKMDFSSYELFVGMEGLTVHQEPWNFDNISKIFPSYIDSCLSQEIICSGVIGGTREALISLYDKMFNLCEEGEKDHLIKDQAALIVMASNNLLKGVKYFNLDDGWAVHCAVSGPTDFFELWGFKNNIPYGIPFLSDGRIMTGAGIPFDIVHQFNRIPEWNNAITLKGKS